MKRAVHKTLLGSFALLLVVACSQTPPTHFYVFDLGQSVDGRAESREGWDIGVRSFVVDAPYDRDKIAYRVGEESPEIHYYAYHLWAAPLSQLMADSVADGLAGTEGVRSIEPLLPGRRYDAYLEGRVRAVEEVDRPDRQSVRLLIDLLLLSAGQEEIWSESLRLEGSTNTTEVEVVVKLMNAILGEGLSKTRTSLASALALQRPPELAPPPQ